MSDKLPTHISEVCWCNPSVEAGYKIETARLKLPSRPLPRPTAWLDELLDGGFEVPVHKGGKRQALGILLTGPPGTGKSTFALELAYRWSCLAGADLPAHIQEITGKRPLQVLYATLEATAEEMIHNAASYQWRNFTERARAVSSLADLKEGRVNVISFANMEMTAGGAPVGANPSGRPNNWLERIARTIKVWAVDYAGNQPPFSDKTPPRPPDVLIMDGLNSIPDEENREQFYQQYAQLLGSHPLIVIFILDISPTNERSEFWEFASDVVIKLDRQHHHPGDLYYLIRHLEIVKARFQYHAWGKHQLKIFKGYDGEKNPQPGMGKLPKVAERLRSHAYRSEGGIFIFPSIHFLLSGYEHMAPEGNEKSTRPECYKPKVPNLGKILGNGFPIGRCTALIGERGGHKSHLGYVELLYRVVYPEGCRAGRDEAEANGQDNLGDAGLVKKSLLVFPEPPSAPLEEAEARPPLLPPATPKTSFLHRSQVAEVPPEAALAAKLSGPGGTERIGLAKPAPGLAGVSPKKKCSEKALIVSLRDDEGTTRRTMTKILDRWREFDPKVPTLDLLEEKGLVEIIYFPPGYITPEEFYHRLVLSINRLKHGDDSEPGISLLFTSLDKLATRFPMCAKEPIFIPGIVQMLAGEKVTSIFVAASEEGHSDYYGLGSMADVILEFEHRDFPRDEVRAHLAAVMPGNQAMGIYNSESAKRKNQSLRRAVVVTVGRFSGGHSAGAEGILELLDDDAARRDLDLGQAYASEHLIFIPRNHMQKGEFGFDPRAAVRSGVFLNQ